MNQERPAARFPVLVGLMACLGVVTAVSAEELAFDRIEPAIKYRQNVMAAMGGLVGISAGRLRDGLTFGPELPEVARALQAMTRDVAALFPEGTDFGETEAKPDVWERPEEFARASQTLRERVDSYLAATAEGDRVAMLKAFKAVGEACKSCHKDFRKPHEH